MKVNKLYIVLILSVLGVSCQYQKVLKKGTASEKFVFAKKLYDKGDFGRTMPLLEGLIGNYGSGVDPEEVYFFYAFTHFNLGDFSLAAYHFDNFSKNYSKSKYAEEAVYMSARCEYHRSLPYNLDQTTTFKAMERIQLFVDKYPKSKFVPECNDLIDKLREKLHNKAYDVAMLYYNIGSYRSAVVSFKNAVIDYPDIPQLEEIEFLIVESQYLYAVNSVIKSQVERFDETIKLANEYLSSHKKETDSYKKVLGIIEKSKKAKLVAHDELKQNK